MKGGLFPILHSAFFILHFILLCASAASCAESVNRYDQVMRQVRLLSNSPNVRLLPFGKSAGGRCIPAFVISDFAANPDEKARILVCAGQHGSEYAAVKSIMSLSVRLASDVYPGILSECVFVVVPMVNPDGVAAERRLNLGGTDINRDWGIFSTPEARHVDTIIRAWKPHLLIDAHEWTEPTRIPGNEIEVAMGTSAAQESALKFLALQARREVGVTLTRSHSYSNPGLFHRKYTCQGYAAYLIETAFGEDYPAKNRVYSSVILTMARSVAANERCRVELSPASEKFCLSAVKPYLEPLSEDDPTALASTFYGTGLLGLGYSLLLCIMKPFRKLEAGRWSRRFRRCDVEADIETSPLCFRHTPKPITSKSWINRRLRARYAGEVESQRVESGEKGREGEACLEQGRRSPAELLSMKMRGSAGGSPSHRSGVISDDARNRTMGDLKSRDSLSHAIAYRARSRLSATP
ncbi:MAG: hypothetical protein M1133_02985 [Armatimonadetes bacterium]|nr:hypothetical protein [Armatimonadota bacterium]